LLPPVRCPYNFQEQAKLSIEQKITDKNAPDCPANELTFDGEDHSYFQEFWHRDNDYDRSSETKVYDCETVVKNATYIGNMVFMAIENEFLNGNDSDLFVDLVQNSSMYQEIFMIFLGVWRQIYRKELFQYGYDAIVLLILKCLSFSIKNKELSFPTKILALSEAYYIDVSEGIKKGLACNSMIGNLKSKKEIGLDYKIIFCNKSPTTLKYSFIDKNDISIEAGGLDPFKSFETDTNTNNPWIIYRQDSDGGAGQPIAIYIPPASFAYTESIGIVTDSNLKTTYTSSNFVRRKFILEGLTKHEIWNSDDFWVAFLLGKLR
jgi:hypothetical protein